MRPAIGEQMHDRVGRAADRAVDHDRVLERLPGEDLRHPQILVHHLDDAPAGHAREHAGGANRRRESRRWSAGRCPAPRPSTPSSTPCPSSCSGRPSATCTTRPRPCRHRFISPVFSISVNFHTCVPEPMSSPRNLPFSIGPPETPIVGRSHDAAPISSAGVVLSQPISSTTPSNGLARIDSSTSIAAWLRNSIVVGRISVSPRLITGNSIGKPPASSTPSRTCCGELAEVRVARRGLRPGVADADDRPAVELVVRDALVLHPRAVDERVAVVAAEPGRASGACAWLRSFLRHGVDRCGVAACIAQAREPAAPVAWSNTCTMRGVDAQGRSRRPGSRRAGRA